jgi:hypothetical protein
MVTTLDAQVPVTPAGKPLNVAPVATVVLYVILVIGEFWQTVCALVPGAELSAIVHGGARQVMVNVKGPKAPAKP